MEEGIKVLHLCKLHFNVPFDFFPLTLQFLFPSGNPLFCALVD